MGQFADFPERPFSVPVASEHWNFDELGRQHTFNWKLNSNLKRSLQVSIRLRRLSTDHARRGIKS